MPLPAYAVILAGGYGTRFWPLSRRARPKQFLPLTGEDSLLQQTYRRLSRLFPPSHIYVVGNAEHRRLLLRQLPRVPAGRLLLEPAGRNTAAAIALAAEHVRAALPVRAQDAALGIFPADHALRHEVRFRQVVRAALAAAAGDAMIVVGIPPTEPHTGYGYIERGRGAGRARGINLFSVRRFTEKPDVRTARRYLQSGRFTWNSGMFFWRLSTFDALLARHLPATRAAFQSLAPYVRRRDYPQRLKRTYRGLQNISIDYAVAEPAAAHGQARMLPARMGWSDLGSWSALYAWLVESDPAARDNPGGADLFALGGAENLVVVPRGKFTAVVGMRDVVVADTPAALLVCARNRAQDVGKVVNYLKKHRRGRLL